ncbi:MAG: HAD-IIB family hydrolase [Bryobacteraceae bacterium]
MRLVISDLDGTLLDSTNYSNDAARRAIDELRRRFIPLVLCTSKTRAEVEYWRERLNNPHPFIVENGGAVYIPKGYFPFPVSGAVERDDYDVVELGTPYGRLAQELRAISRESSCAALGFADMSVADVSLKTGLPVRQAELAKRREYDEPFEILGAGTYRLLDCITAHGLHWTRGDRFYHITGNNSKAEASRRLVALYRQAFGTVSTIGLGDGHNDTGLLREVDFPVVVLSPFAPALVRAVPRSTVSRFPGPRGWSEAVLRMVS